MTQNLYETLGVDRDASPEDIRSAYRKRAKETHPDAGGTTEQFQAVAVAHRILSDDEKRRTYDQTGQIDDAPDNTEAMAAELIEEFLAMAVNDPNAKYLDLVIIMKDSIKKSMDEGAAQMGKMIAQEARARDLLRRFKTDKAKNTIAMLLNRRLASIRKSMTAMERRMKAHERALAIIGDYSFDTEAPFHFVYPSTTSTNSTFRSSNRESR